MEDANYAKRLRKIIFCLSSIVVNASESFSVDVDTDNSIFSAKLTLSVDCVRGEIQFGVLLRETIN